MSAQDLHDEGLKLYKLKQYSEAVEYFSKALAADANHKESLLRKSMALLRLEDADFLQEISELIERAITIDPNFKKAIVTKGNILMAIMAIVDDSDIPFLFKQAFECAEKALAIDPNYVKALVLKQALHGRLSDYKNAIDCSNKALALKPNSTSALLLRGTMLMLMRGHKMDAALLKEIFPQTNGEIEDPIAVFNKITEIDPKKEEAWFAKGHVHLEKGEKEAALAAFKALADINGTFKEKADMLVMGLSK